ncbi:hypothetical protein BC829DRAFT_19248 [Chytridium lagenaria]|nr:hypothetical protein BC829DRAFT_19248 [Chytridium lagenaria]
MNSLNDGHISYVPRCISGFYFRQPWNTCVCFFLCSSWEGTLAGKSPGDYVGWNVVSIDGVDAIAGIQAFADKLSGISRDPETRFNFVLLNNQFINGNFSITEGSFYATDFLGHDAAATRTYVVQPPQGGSTVTIVVPWVASPPMETFANAQEFQAKICDAPAPAAARMANDFLTIPAPLDPTPLYALSDEILRTVTSKRSGKLNLSNPTSGDKANVFYMMDDGETGVWMWSTVSPEGDAATAVPQFLAGISGGLRALEALGGKTPFD